MLLITNRISESKKGEKSQTENLCDETTPLLPRGMEKDPLVYAYNKTPETCPLLPSLSKTRIERNKQEGPSCKSSA
jgi:hypothetical protein